MRIAIDIRKIGLKSTGDEVYTYYLVKELAGLKESRQHEFFLLTNRSVKKVKKSLPSLPPNFKIFEVKPAAKIFWTFYSLPRFLAKNPVDILHVQYICPLFLPKGIKVVTTIHDVSFKVNPSWVRKKDSFLLNNFIPLTLQKADQVITVSNFSKKEIVKRFAYPEEKVTVTYPAVDARLFQKRKTTDDKTVEMMKKSSPFILHVSSMQPRKNVPLVIKAFSELKDYWEKEKTPWRKTKLIIVGGRNGYNYDKKIDEEINKTKYKEEIIFSGYVQAEKIPLFYSAARLFIFPSSYEGFGIPLLEAMVSGTPVLASELESFKEIDGKTGAVSMVEIKKQSVVQNLAQKAKKLVEDEKMRSDKIRLGKERARFFSWKTLAQKTMKIYQKIGQK